MKANVFRYVEPHSRAAARWAFAAQQLVGLHTVGCLNLEKGGQGWRDFNSSMLLAANDRHSLIGLPSSLKALMADKGVPLQQPLESHSLHLKPRAEPRLADFEHFCP